MVPLQFDIGGPLGLLGTLLLLIIAFLVGRYVYRDAAGRGMNETLWGFGTGIAILLGLLPGLLVLLVYVVVRE